MPPPPSAPPSSAGSRRSGSVLVVVGILLLAVNLRPAAVSVGPVLAEIRADLGMSGVGAGLLTSLPVIAFAVFGAAAPRLSARVGPHRLTLLALVAALVGIFGRSFAPGTVSFLGLSLVALAGMATANVLLPSLVKQHFPDRVGLLTAVYSTGLAIGVTVASIFTVPLSQAEISQAYGGWRVGIGVWGATAVLALIPWIALLGHDRRRADDHDDAPSPMIGFGAVARTRLGWIMAGFFGLQALQAYAVFGWFANIYRDFGASPADAGLLLGVVTGTGIPLGFAVPALTGRMRNPIPLLVAVVACYPVGYLGLLLSPWSLPWLWAILVGIGTSTFPMILVLIGLRARTTQGTAGLSGFTQSVGYLISALGPFGMGVLHELTGGWTAALLALTVLSLPLLVLGVAAIRSGPLEDQLPGSERDRPPPRA